jgi:hypothetical protein
VPHGYDSWDHESVPTGGIAIVEVAKRTRVLKVFKPKMRYTGAGYSIGLRNCDVGPYFFTICNSGLKYGISAWLAVSTVGRTEWSCETNCDDGATPASAGAGATSIRFHNLRPGLYQRGLVFPLNGTPNPAIGRICPWSEPNSNSCPSEPPWMWINPINDGVAGGDIPASGQGKWTQFWCDPATRGPAIAAGAAMDPPVIIQPCGSGGGGGGGLGMGGGGGA